MENYVGRKFNDRYLLNEIIGVGGMSVVYKAYDEIDDKTVAIKILKDEFLANSDFRRRFKNESKAIAVLSHHNIVKVYDVNFGEDLQYIVMEYVEGITLKEYIEKKGVVDWSEAVYFTMQILKALQHAHDKGIIHRDVKPQNIILLQDGTIKVTDFGIARFNRGDTHTIAEGNAIGSVHYISPEQARGSFTDEKSDIYSVGVVLYEMITGQLPFQSDNAVSVAIMQLQKNAEMPRSINPHIPVGIEQITMRAMQKSPRDRYQSAAEMILDLEEFKRNPGIKFDYTYFVDKQPTKYVPPVDESMLKNGGYNQDTQSDDDDDDEYYIEDSSARHNRKTMTILISVIAALVIAVGAASWFFFFRNKNELIVPDFTNKTIDEVFEKYPEFEKYIEKNPVYTSEYEPGIVFNQNVPKGTDLSTLSNKVIKLDYADPGNTQQIPEFSKSTTLEAYQTQLRTLGFNVKLEPIVTKDYALGQIISTDPAAGSYKPVGTLVTVSYAADDKTVAIPDFVGDTLEQAQKDLRDIGFKNNKIKVEYEVVTDTTLVDHVIRQSIVQSTFVDPESSEITLYVGKLQSEQEAECSFMLPDLSAYDETDARTVTVFTSDGTEVYKSDAVLDGSAYTFKVSGKSISEYYVMIDGQKVCSVSVDYTITPPAVYTTPLGYSYTPKTTVPVVVKDIVIPSVTGMTEQEAKDAVLEAGFRSCSVVSVSSDTVPEGIVVSVQSASKETSFTAEEAAAETVYIYVSKGY